MKRRIKLLVIAFISILIILTAVTFGFYYYDSYKIDTEKERELAAVFAVRSIPTLLFCPMGENPQIAQGALPKEQLKEAIDKVLLKK